MEDTYREVEIDCGLCRLNYDWTHPWWRWTFGLTKGILMAIFAGGGAL